MITQAQMQEFCPAGVKYVDWLNKAFDKFEINTPQRVCFFLAQVAEESRYFTRTHEIFDYTPEALMEVFGRHGHITEEQADTLGRQEGESFVPAVRQIQIANIVYANRMGNGDVNSGDGSRYRGRGLIELTGKDNYVHCEHGLQMGLIQHPEILELPSGAAMSAAWYWTSGTPNGLNLNELADENEFEQVTLEINGGELGESTREELLAKAQAIWA